MYKSIIYSLSVILLVWYIALECVRYQAVWYTLSIENNASSQNNVGACTCLTGVNFLLCISRQCDVLTNNHDEVV